MSKIRSTSPADLLRHIEEQDREIARQSDLLRQALEVARALLTDKELEIISHMSPNCGDDYYFCFICGNEAATAELIAHKVDCLYLQLEALIPALEEVIK